MIVECVVCYKIYQILDDKVPEICGICGAVGGMIYHHPIRGETYIKDPDEYREIYRKE